MEDSDKNCYDIKMILLGELGTGKTNLISAYINESYNENSYSTLQPTQSYKIVLINDIKLKVCLWDTCGQEEYRSITKNFIKGSHIVIFVYDITRKETFLELNYWVNSALEELGNKESIFGVAANKTDLFEKSEVEDKEGREYARSIGALFHKTSGKEDPNGFKDYVDKLIENLLVSRNIIQKGESFSHESFSLQKTKKKSKHKSCCS